MAASKTYSAQTALNTCPDHEHVRIEMYCKTCKKAVCTKCVDEDHEDHDWDTLIAIAKELRKQTIQLKLVIESATQSILVGTEEFLNSLNSTAENEHEVTCSALEKKRKSIVEFVNKSFDEMKSKCRRSHITKMTSLNERKTELGRKGKRIKFLIQNMVIGARDYTDSDLIELHDEIHQVLTELQALSVLPQDLRSRMVYRPGSSDLSPLELLAGTIEDDQSAPKVILEAEFIHGKTDINSVHLISEDEAWIHHTQTIVNNLVDKSGTIMQTRDLGCRVYNFSMSDDRSMYLCDPSTSTVQKVDEQGDVKSLFSTAPMMPLFINITRSRDLLITLVDENSDNRNSSSRRLVRRTSISGEVIKEYEYDNDGNTPLFCVPVRPVEHVNGNICVINQYREDSDNHRGSIYGLHYRNNVIFKYDGTGDASDLMDVCFDNESNILISDANHRVHIIDCNGNFMCFLLTEESFNELLYAIDIFGIKLWIGSAETGLVKVFNVKN